MTKKIVPGFPWWSCGLRALLLPQGAYTESLSGTKILHANVAGQTKTSKTAKFHYLKVKTDFTLFFRWSLETGTPTEEMLVGRGARSLDESSRVCVLWWVRGSLTGQEGPLYPSCPQRIKRPPVERGNLRISSGPVAENPPAHKGHRPHPCSGKTPCRRGDKPCATAAEALTPESRRSPKGHICKNAARTPQLERSPRPPRLEGSPRTARKTQVERPKLLKIN